MRPASVGANNLVIANIALCSVHIHKTNTNQTFYYFPNCRCYSAFTSNLIWLRVVSNTNTKYFKVFIRIDEALSNVEDPDILTEILLQTGAFHKKIPGFRPEMFWVRLIPWLLWSLKLLSNTCTHFQYAEEPFLDTLKVTLDERYTPQMDVIYHVIAKYIIQTLVDGYNRPWYKQQTSTIL